MSIIFVIGISSCNLPEKQFILEGDVGVFTHLNGKTLYLCDFVTQESTDSAIVKDNTFIFYGKANPLRILTLSIPASNPMDASTTLSVPFFSESGTLKIDLSEMASATGSSLNNQLHHFEMGKRELSDSSDTDLSQTMISQPCLESSISALATHNETTIHPSTITAFSHLFLNNSDNLLGTYLLYSMRNNLSKDKFFYYFDKGGNVVKKHPRILEAKRDIEKNVAIKSGDHYIDFTGFDTKNNPKKLSSFIGNGNYLVMDFWASWCGPCCSKMGQLKTIYETYHERGLEIIGIAVSEKVENHLTAIEKYHITWPQILDSNKEGAFRYGIIEIPHLILFSPEGEIIETNISLNQLEHRLSTIFQ